MKSRLEEIVINEALIDKKIINEIRNIMEMKEESFDDVLINESVVDYKILLEILSIRFGVKNIDLDNLDIKANIVKSISKAKAVKFCALPFDENEGKVHIALNNPLDIEAINEISFFMKKEVIPFKGLKNQINKYIKVFFDEQEGEIALNELKSKVTTDDST